MVSLWHRHPAKETRPQPAPAGPAGRDRRAAPRFPCSFRTTCQPIALVETIAVPVQVRNVSTGGIGLLCRAPVPPGTFFAIELQNNRGGSSLRLRARVIHTTRHDGKTWLLGCAFTEPLSDEQLQSLL